VKISALIEKLREQQDLYGDIQVESRCLHGEFSTSIVLLGCETGVSIEAFSLSEEDSDE